MLDKQKHEKSGHRHVKELCERKLQKLGQRRFHPKSKGSIQEKGNHETYHKRGDMRDHILNVEYAMKQQVAHVEM